MWRLPGKLLVRGDGGALRGEGASLAGQSHARRVRPQVVGRAAARPHLRRLQDQGPPLLQVHAAGRSVSDPFTNIIFETQKNGMLATG